MIRRIALLLGLFGTLLLANPLQAAAFDPFGGVNCSGKNAQSAVCTDKPKGSSDPVAGPNGILTKATNIIALVAGVGAIVVLLIGSLNYITSNGDSSKIQSGKNTVINALIGIAIIVVVRTIIVFVINKLS